MLNERELRDLDEIERWLRADHPDLARTLDRFPPRRPLAHALSLALGALEGVAGTSALSAAVCVALGDRAPARAGLAAAALASAARYARLRLTDGPRRGSWPPGRRAARR